MIFNILIGIVMIGVMVKNLLARFWLGGLLAAAVLVTYAAAINAALGTPYPSSRAIVSSTQVVVVATPLVWLAGRRHATKLASLSDPRNERVKEAADLLLLPWFFIAIQVFASM